MVDVGIARAPKKPFARFLSFRISSETFDNPCRKDLINHKGDIDMCEVSVRIEYVI